MASLRLDGRPLSRDEMLGYAHVTFAGGRDSVINAVPAAIVHLADHPEDLTRLSVDPGLIPTAAEEVVRRAPPLSQIGPHLHPDR